MQKRRIRSQRRRARFALDTFGAGYWGLWAFSSFRMV